MPSRSPLPRRRQSYQFVGEEVMADFYGCAADLNDPLLMRRVTTEAIARSGMTEIRTITFPFAPQGVDLVSILAESSVIMHTYPEHKAVFLNVFTCGVGARPLDALRYYVSALEPKRLRCRVVSRGGKRPANRHLQVRRIEVP